jgi:hypothetical protein
MFEEALQARLQVLEEEILRVAKLASQSSERIDQENYQRLAQDLQREAREVRAQLRRIIKSSEATHRVS